MVKFEKYKIQNMANQSPVIPFAIILTLTVFVAVQATVSRCFQFTWLGPDYNSESVFENATCSDATRLAGGVPCVHPLVVSRDGSWPDVHYIWRNHPEASCILGNEVCAKYTYYFNGVVENATYFCTRAVNDLGNAITSGCHEQVNGSYTTRVCFCRSIPGAVPCNSGITLSVNYVTIILSALPVVFQYFYSIIK